VPIRLTYQVLAKLRVAIALETGRVDGGAGWVVAGTVREEEGGSSEDWEGHEEEGGEEIVRHRW
jgi:hypothetical protein